MMARPPIVDLPRSQARPLLIGRRALHVAVAALLISGALSSLTAQGPSLSVAPRGGITIPVGNFSHYVDPGPGFGVRLTYGVAPRVHLVLDGGYNQFSGSPGVVSGTTVPDMRLAQVTGGLAADLLPPDRSLSAVFHVGVGAARLDADSFVSRNGSRTMTLEDTGLATNGGFQLGYALTPNLTLFGDGRVNFFLVEQDKTLPLAHHLQMGVLKFIATMPLQIGIRAGV